MKSIGLAVLISCLSKCLRTEFNVVDGKASGLGRSDWLKRSFSLRIQATQSPPLG